MEEKQRNGILIVIGFFELRRMNFSKTWIELIIWGTISKRACYKWRVSTDIPKHWNQWGKWVATLFKNFFVSWYPTRVLYISTGGRILDETLPLVIRYFTFHVLISDETLLYLFDISPLRVWISHEILPTSLCLDIPLVFCIFPLVAGYWTKHSHWWFGISLFMSWYQTKRSFICLIYHL